MAWNSKDLEAFMAFVADDAVLDRGPHGVVEGTEQIRSIVTLEMEEDLRVEVSWFEVTGDEVMYYYEVFSGGSLVDHGFGVAIVQGGKIISDLPAQ